MQECQNSEKVTEMLRSHVERALQSIWEQTDLVVDDDGDYAFRSRTAACWVRIVGGDQPAVRVFAQAAVGVPSTKKVFEEISELNARSRWAKISWCHGVVVVDESIHWLSVDRDAIERAMESVMVVSDDIGPMIATVYGGETPFPLDLETASSDEDAA
jgi:hypothetical protein